MPMEVDLSKPYGIKNLPKKWESKIIASFISEDDILSDPQAIITLISSYN
jgi:hypothetical protein